MGPAVFAMTQGRLYPATISMTVNFIAPAKPGPIIGEAIVRQLGKTIALIEGHLLAHDNTLLVTSSANARLIEAGAALR
jgi:acyl-coenzyme A thioesterase PaaI-like protein